MTHALIIGNSHTVPLRQAWRSAGEAHPRHRLSFFVAPQPTFKYLRGDGQWFGIPPTGGKGTAMVERLNGRARIDLGGFDQIVLVGFGDRCPQLTELILRCDIDGLREASAPSRLSRPTFEAICRHIAEDAINPKLLRRVSARPLAIVEMNRPGERCVESDDPRYVNWPELVRRPEGVDAALTAYSEIFAALLGQKGIALLPQPRETILSNGLTDRRFTDGSISLTGGKQHPEGDSSHANAAYGKICLAKIFDFLDEARSPTLAMQA